MRTQRVLRPILSIEEVQASLDTFGDRIIEKLDERLPALPAPGNAADGPFSYQGVFDELGRDLASLRSKIVEAEDLHVRRQAVTATTARKAEELGKDLYGQQVAVRRILGGAYTPDRSFELAAVSGVTPRNFRALEEQVDQTVKFLREPVDENPPEIQVAGVTIDFEDMAGGLETRRDAFRAQRAELERARKASGESKVLLDEVLEECQGSFPWIAQVLEGFARMAGERELAERIRTSIRRVTRRQRTTEDESGETPDGQAADGASPGESLPEPSSAEPGETAPSGGADSAASATPDGSSTGS